ncbi:MAG: hypothetical protein WBM86_32170 [Waterburya sp.]
MLALVLTPTPVFAQQTEVTISPTQLDIVGIEGSIVTRRLFVNTPQPIKKVQLIPPDLNRSDGTQIFPPEVVQIPGILSEQSQHQCLASTLQKLAASSQESNEAILPVCFDLKNAPSGAFSSQLQLSYQGGRQLVPITIKVKAHWLLPLVVLLVGTALGITVSAYRAQGQPRDEILVRVGRLRGEMQEDTELVKASSFQSEIEAHLYDVRVGLQGDKLETARNAIEQAEQVWAKWIKGRVDWLNQFAYWEELNQRLQDLNPNIPYVQLVRRKMEDASREANGLEGPDQLRDLLDELAEQINRFLKVQAFGKQLRDLLAQLTSEEKPNWESKILGWERQINQIQPSELMEDGTLVEEMEGAISEMGQLIAQQSGSSGMTKGILSIPHLAPAPSARPLSWEQQVSVAGVRLRWFTRVSYAISLLFLTGAGFNQLYWDNSTFGANPWKDYFALLAWGFGAEATRDAITKMIQGWGLVGVKES